MNTVGKLIIITSPNGDEYANEYKHYWNLGEETHPIIKNGSKRGLFKSIAISPQLNLAQLETYFNVSGYVVMIHHQNTQLIERRSIQKDGKVLTYTVYYYSTQELSLNGDLWNIGNDYQYTGPEKDTVCPFDQLRMAIATRRDSSPAERAIIDWVERKTVEANMMEVCLCVLNNSLTPEYASHVTKVNDYDLVKDIHVVDGLSVDLFIKNKLVPEKDNTSATYNKNLSLLRDVLLAQL